jgi:hypothetical protein
VFAPPNPPLLIQGYHGCAKQEAPAFRGVKRRGSKLAGHRIDGALRFPRRLTGGGALPADWDVSAMTLHPDSVAM